ncbi:MAG: PIN domain-containing protein [Candidatus Thorarchaeota archaeon]|nr:PIN domain-containing protein [Candidatus Thorarchaeota archaeon]
MGAPLYDTNILINLMRDSVDTIEGSTTSLNLIEFPKAAKLKGLKVIVPGRDDYDLAFELASLLLKKGSPIPAVDLVIAAVALNRNMTLQTTDRHFEMVQKVNDKLSLEMT